MCVYLVFAQYQHFSPRGPICIMQIWVFHTRGKTNSSILKARKATLVVQYSFRRIESRLHTPFFGRREINLFRIVSTK